MYGKSYVYVLVLNNEPILKIGKADNVLNRIKQLEEVWGSFNYNKSFVFECERSYVNKLERGLHAMFHYDRIENLEKKDGYSEFFHISTYDYLFDILKTSFSRARFVRKISLMEYIEIINISNLKDDHEDIFLVKKQNKEKVEHDLIKKEDLEFVNAIKYKDVSGLFKLYKNLYKKITTSQSSTKDIDIEVSKLRQFFKQMTTDRIPVTSLIYHLKLNRSSGDKDSFRTLSFILGKHFGDSKTMRANGRAAKCKTFHDVLDISDYSFIISEEKEL